MFIVITIAATLAYLVFSFSVRKKPTKDDRLIVQLGLIGKLQEHVLIIGKTGSGKTSLLKNMLLELMPYELGFFFKP